MHAQEEPEPALATAQADQDPTTEQLSEELKKN